MEAATLPTKGKKVSKGKIKKTMKNILCRPDPSFWPVISTEDGKAIQECLSKLKVTIPNFIKPHWSEVKMLKKSERPKAPKIDKVEGLIFGMSSCSEAITDKTCAAIIIEADVNPRILVQHIIDMSCKGQIPTVCLKGLHSISKNYFGIATSCLGFIENNGVKDVVELISNISQKYIKYQHISKEVEKMEVETEPEIVASSVVNLNVKTSEFTYLYRTSNKIRIFKPPDENTSTKERKAFAGQDFIEFPTNTISSTKSSYKKMIVNKITNNPSRLKRK